MAAQVVVTPEMRRRHVNRVMRHRALEALLEERERGMLNGEALVGANVIARHRENALRALHAGDRKHAEHAYGRADDAARAFWSKALWWD